MKNIGKYLIGAVSAVGVAALALVSMPKVIAADYYANCNFTSGELLQRSLSEITGTNYKSVSYDNLWPTYAKTDVKPGTNIIWDMYSSYEFTTDQHGSYSKAGDKYNREHSIPQSWFGKATPMVSDMHHIYPTDGYVNGIRSNWPYGEVTDVTYTSNNGCKLGTSNFPGYTGKAFEIADEYKGDIARTYFYMATRYYDKIASWPLSSNEGKNVFQASYPYLTDYAVALFTKWDAQDPVSQKEIDRNNAVYSYQNNRNPFIDHPELSDYIFRGKAIGSNPISSSYAVPSTGAASSSSSTAASSSSSAIQSSSSSSTSTPISSSATGTGSSTIKTEGASSLEIIAKPNITFTGYKADQTFTFDKYEFYTNVAFADSQAIVKSQVRIGGNLNNAKQIPSKYNVVGTGGILEAKFDLEYVNSLEFAITKEYEVENWYVVTSADEGATWSVVGSGEGGHVNEDGSTTYTCQIAKAKPLSRFALIVANTNEGKTSRVDVHSIKVGFDTSAQVNDALSTRTTNQFLDINYKIKGSDITINTVKMGISFHVNLDENYDNAQYGFILVKNPTAGLNLENVYNGEDAKTFIAQYGEFLEADIETKKKEIVCKTTFTYDPNATYLAVGVAVVDGKLYFASQNNLLSVSEVATKLIGSGLVVNKEQLAVLKLLTA